MVEEGKQDIQIANFKSNKAEHLAKKNRDEDFEKMKEQLPQD